MNKEGWLKVGVVGVPICAYIMLVHLPTTSPYGYSSFQKEENGDTIDFLVSLFSTISDSSSPFPEVNRNHNRTTYLVSSR